MPHRTAASRRTLQRLWPQQDKSSKKRNPTIAPRRLSRNKNGQYITLLRVLTIQTVIQFQANHKLGSDFFNAAVKTEAVHTRLQNDITGSYHTATFFFSSLSAVYPSILIRKSITARNLTPDIPPLDSQRHHLIDKAQHKYN